MKIGNKLGGGSVLAHFGLFSVVAAAQYLLRPFLMLVSDFLVSLWPSGSLFSTDGLCHRPHLRMSSEPCSLVRALGRQTFPDIRICSPTSSLKWSVQSSELEFCI